MKGSVIIIQYLVSILIIFSCNTEHQQHQKMDKQTNLIIKMTARPNLPVGYATTFKCNILEVVQGHLEMDSIILTVMGGNKNNAELISKRLSSNGFEVGFKKLKENEPRSLAPITGFVDSNRTSWEIEYIN